MNHMENWKDIAGYEGRYQISNHGRARNAAGELLTPNKITSGYLAYHLYKGGKISRRVVTAHKLVALHFLYTPESKAEINHKDFDKLNNHASNLEWVTRLQNVRHTIDSGRQGFSGRAVLSTDLMTGEERAYESQIAAERTLRGKQTGLISRVLQTGRAAYGLLWRKL